MSFCFYCWLAILLAFRGAINSSTLLSVWGVVFILASGMYQMCSVRKLVFTLSDLFALHPHTHASKVYFAMEVWITRGAYEAVRVERAKLKQLATAPEPGPGDMLLSMGGFIF